MYYTLKGYYMAQFYLVGGAVRDELLGISSKDLDYSVEADSYSDMKKAILDRGGKVFVEHPEFLTIRAKIPGHGACDYVLCRKESSYSDGRRPDEVIPGSLHDDLARRDFTMNAIAKDEDGNYIDPFNGKLDIEDNVIRCVGSAHDRFEEDALRLLRAIRFCVTKDMLIDRNILACMHSPSIVRKLDSVSVERMYDEMTKMFEHNTLKSLQIIEEFPLIREVVFSKMKLLPSLKKG